MEDREGQKIPRRKLLGLLGIGVTGLAGCSSGDSEGNGDETPTQEPTATPTEESGTGNDETPTPEDTETPTPEETPTGTPENGEEELFVPDGLNEENYRALIEQIEQDESLAPETVLTTLGVTEEQVSDPGYATLQSLIQEEPDETAMNLVEKIVNYGENHGQIGTPQARVLSAAPMSAEEYVNAVLNGNLEQSSDFEQLTEAETDLFEVSSFQSQDIQSEYEQIVQALSDNGFTEEEIEYLTIAAQYGSERPGGDNRVDQARENDLWVTDIEGSSVNQQILGQFRDSDQDYLINAVDSNPDQYTSSEDIYPDSVVQSVFKGDPEETYVALAVESTSDVDESNVREAVNFVGDKLAEHDINLIAFQGRNNVNPVTSNQEAESLLSPPNGERISEYMGLGAHYMLFVNKVEENVAGRNWDTQSNLPGVGYTDTQFVGYEGENHFNGFGHELAAMLGGRSVDHLDAKEDEIDSEAEAESFQSYVNQYDPDKMRFIQDDIDAIRESGFNLGAVQDGEAIGAIPDYRLSDMYHQDRSLDEEFDVIYASETDLSK